MCFRPILKIFKYDHERNKYPLFMYYFIKTTIDVPFVVINTMLFAIIAGFMTNITHRVFELMCVLVFVALSERLSVISCRPSVTKTPYVSS